MKGTATYQLLRGRKYVNGKWHEVGDLIELTESQALNLRLSIEPYDSAAHVSTFEEVTSVDTEVDTEEDFKEAEFKTTLAEDDSPDWVDPDDEEPFFNPIDESHDGEGEDEDSEGE